MGYRDYFAEPVIITVTPTGGNHGKETNPNLPEQPEGIADRLERPLATPAGAG